VSTELSSPGTAGVFVRSGGSRFCEEASGIHPLVLTLAAVLLSFSVYALFEGASAFGSRRSAAGAIA